MHQIVFYRILKSIEQIYYYKLKTIYIFNHELKRILNKNDQLALNFINN